MHRWRASIVAALCVLTLAAFSVVAWGDDPPVTTISITKSAQATGGGIFTWTLQPAMQPRPGERLCYPYEIVLTNADAGASYRNVATAIIYNHEGHWLEPYGLTTYTNFTLGQGSSNASADLTDVVSAQPGLRAHRWTTVGLSPAAK